MRSMRTTGYQATNLGLAIEEVGAAVLLTHHTHSLAHCNPAGQQDAALAAER
jgi:hypothetical protein